jgi:hypothetical protein
VLTETNYCSRCGFLLTGTQELLRTGGVIPDLAPVARSSAGSPRNRGLKQGLFIFLLSFLVVPIISILTVAAGAEPFAVVISALLLFVGGLLRMAYAMLFESASPRLSVEESAGINAFTSRQADPHALPPQRQVYTPPPGGNWRDTNDLQPTSVTENTTKLLHEDEQLPLDNEPRR